MAMSIGTKAARVLRLLLGLRNSRIATSLAMHGFTENDMMEGWELLQALGKMRFDTVLLPTDVQTIQALDTWENVWFPIASAALARRYPASHAHLFLNLSQTEGPEVAVSIRTLLDRLDVMSKGEAPYGAEGTKAAELLAARGMTGAVIAEARNMLATLAKVAPPLVPLSVEEQREQQAEAERAVWEWYLEWSQVARVAIRQRSLLRQLGFLGDRPAEEEDEPEVPAPPATGTEPNPPTAPVIPPTVVPATN
jgi:hypothetical protein